MNQLIIRTKDIREICRLIGNMKWEYIINKWSNGYIEEDYIYIYMVFDFWFRFWGYQMDMNDLLSYVNSFFLGYYDCCPNDSNANIYFNIWISVSSSFEILWYHVSSSYIELIVLISSLTDNCNEYVLDMLM